VTDLATINFETTSVPSGGAGQLYNVVIRFTSGGGAALPDQFELDAGVLPTGVEISRDREDNDFDGLPDPDGAYTGNARLLGYPRESGSFAFTVKAISTGELAPQPGDQPALAATADFVIAVGEGAIAILSPTAAEGTTDPAVPAFPEVVDFVNPANAQAFFSYSFLVAGGSGNNINNVHVPRELELSTFDVAVQALVHPGNHDTDESLFGAGDKMTVESGDGGWFVLQAGDSKVQVGGFQSPRGRVYNPSEPDAGGINQYGDPNAPTPGYDPDWFQRAPGFVHTSLGGENFTVPPQNSRRDFNDTLGLAGGDTTLGTPLPVQFSDYFATVTVTKNDAGADITPFEHPIYEGTHDGFDDPAFGPPLKRRKYPFTSDQYFNAFFVPFVDGVDLTPLKFRLIVEAIDTRGTGTPTDDLIARKAYVAQVRIPDIVIDTVQLPGGQAGVDYTEFVTASGGVPPLSFELEFVDGNGDGVADQGHALTKELFGIELDVNTGQFFGVPRASSLTAGGVDLTVRVYAAVMNPVQGAGNPPQPVPTGTDGEFDGALFPGGESGRHKTFTMHFDAPTLPVVANTSLRPGVDGQAYPGDVLNGAGGVPLLVPYPVGFVGTYPSATAVRNYEWQTMYVLDASHPDPDNDIGDADDTVQGLPNSLALVRDPLSATNGAISGITFDRGFHTISIEANDAAVGDGTSPVATPFDVPAGLGTFQQPFGRSLGLSVSPDKALYVRGAQASEATGATPSGLLDEKNQIGEPRMVPMFLSAGLFTLDQGSAPELFNTGVPATFDLLPIMLPNGGSDAHNRKSIPSISGFWPAESNKESNWDYLGATRAWNHLQQETVWAQAPNAAQSRVFLWAETAIKQWSTSATSGGWSKKYQQYAATGKRGVLVLDPKTGLFHMPAVLTNNNAAHGSQFGAEAVIGGDSTSGTGGGNIFYGGAYNKYYYYTVNNSRWDREVQIQGMGSYIESTGGSSATGTGWYEQVQGRSATSLAMSADGLWCATAMPGGAEQKILLFRTDKAPIPDAILAQSYVRPLDGLDADGSVLSNSACIIEPGGETAGGKLINENQRYLLPDSLMFVHEGLLFLNETNLDFVFGISLVDGHLSSKDLNGRTSVNGAGTGRQSVTSNDGQFVPDQDYLRGLQGVQYFSVQFAFKGNRPAAGSAGPDKVAFVAGDNKLLGVLGDLSAQPRDGYVMNANRNKSLLFLELVDGAAGLDLGASTLKDLTGSDSDVYGDLLTPGRLGEELDHVAVSDSGNYVAVVREMSVSGERDVGGWGYMPSFHSYYSSYSSSSSVQGWMGNKDLLLISTQGADMDTGSSAGNGSQHVLYIGSDSFNEGTTTSPGGMPTYATGRSYLNARFRRINGVTFGADERTLIFNYAGQGSFYNPNYTGGNRSYAVNPGGFNSSTFNSVGAQVSLRLHFRTAGGGAINFSSLSSSNMKNNLQGLSGIGNIGPTSPGFADTTGSAQLFWATFKSHNGNFLYYVSDGTSTSARTHMVGFNISAGTINGHAPYTPFSPHGSSVGFEQFDVNSWNYENRFAAVPGGVTLPVTGRSGAGILCVIASDAAAGALSATDLEVYAMDADIGGDLMALTSNVTTGSANAINYLYLSMDGNVLVGQRAETTANSANSRAALTGDSDLFAVTNIHDVLAGGVPNDFIVSAGRSHGSSVAFIGEGTNAGAQAVIFSAAPSGANATWAQRTLNVSVLQAGSTAVILDSTQSHYVVLAGGRKLDDFASRSD
jgi:hypothetical protein